MTPDELGAAADRLFRGSRSRLGRALGIPGKRFTAMMAGRDHAPDGIREDVAVLETEAPRIGAAFDGVAADAEARGVSPEAVTAVAAEWADRRKRDE